MILGRNLIVILLFVVLAVSGHSSFNEAKKAREKLVKKYIKKLRKEEGAIKLIGGQDETEGNVEILHNNRWGNICDDEWDKNEAEIVCRQLGFPGAKKFTHSGQFGPAKRKFWMDNLLCDGTEKELSKCRFDGWGQHDCESSEAAGVVCKTNKTEEITPAPSGRPKKPKFKLNDKFKLEVRLTGGRVKEEGRVEVRFGKASSWGAVCGDGWSLLEANVVCKSLGLGYANDAMQTDFFNGADGNHLQVIMSGTECYGNESSLANCLHHDLIDVTCPGPKHHFASVICVPKLADLVFDHRELEQSAHLEDKMMYFLTCAMEENCVASRAYEIQKENPDWHLETRRLLKFTARVLNSGTADFRPSIPKHLWEWHMCHMHYHSMEVFATFNVIDLNGKKVAEGHKASFCLEDNECEPGVDRKYACANYGDQGISVNCSDIYRHNIDCQWIDISEMDHGTYTIKISVNPEFKVAEMNYDNNAARCTLLYTETYARVFDCITERP